MSRRKAPTPSPTNGFGNGAAIKGAIGDKLELPSVTLADSGAKFHVVVGNQSDGKAASVTSSDVTLTVVTPAAALTHRAQLCHGRQ